MKTTKQTVVFDDTWFYIEGDSFEQKCLHNNEFKDCLVILLTDNQYVKYISEYTNRKFSISESRIDRMFEYINSDTNIWRKQRIK